MNVVIAIVKARLNVYFLSFLTISMCTSRETLKGNQKNIYKSSMFKFCGNIPLQ